MSKWPIGDKGLLHDREWMIVKPSGSCLTQKEEPKLCLIHPHIDLVKSTLTLTAAGQVLITEGCHNDQLSLQVTQL